MALGARLAGHFSVERTDLLCSDRPEGLQDNLDVLVRDVGAQGHYCKQDPEFELVACADAA
eukprot:7659763-Lingulodinium_polyedra.AAC.1